MTDSDPVSRREFFLLASASVAAAATAARTLTAEPESAASGTDELVELSAVEAVGRLKRGDVTAEAYATALLDRCRRGAALNAFITLPNDRVMEAARTADRLRVSGGKLGPLHGLPIPVKDSVNTKDMVTTGGTAALRHFQPKADSPLVEILRGAGAITMGKTNLHELSFGWTSNNLAYGAVHNPYDVRRIPGGSSGGTAVAVATRMAPLGIAEDTEGSIRVPAAMCGIAGLRPSTGRYVTRGVVPITPLFDQIGPHARTVADLALFDSVVTGNWSALPSIGLKGTKLGVSRGYWYRGLDSEVERVSAEALHALTQAGVELVEVEVPELQHLIGLVTNQIQGHDARPALTKYLTENGAGITFDEMIARASPEIQGDFRDLSPGGKYFVSDSMYGRARNEHIPRLKATYRDYFARTGVAAIVFPATMVPPPLIGNDIDVMIDGRKISFETAVARNIAPGSTAGLPGLVLPAGMTTTGLPIALEFDGPSGSDRSLLALGLSLERVLGSVPAPKLA